MPNVRNYTIGDPAQPGKMVVLNGNLDVYDSDGSQTISSGEIIKTATLLAFADTNTSYSNSTDSSFLAMPELTLTVVPSVDGYVLLHFWTEYFNVTAQNSANIYIKNSSFSTIVQADFWNDATYPNELNTRTPATAERIIFLKGGSNNVYTPYLFLQNQGHSGAVSIGGNAHSSMFYAQQM